MRHRRNQRPKGRQMTPREMAEKIWPRIHKQMQFRGIVTPEAGFHLQAWIESLLAEWAEENYQRGINLNVTPMVHAAVQAQIERDAQIAENHEGDASDPCDCVIRQIAEAIRDQLQKEK